ncbi:alanine racemase [Thalassotalea profundi]|uniref:alanine racemase n=1 Tax=Thalassotalea profundi TaxID=2036687 RepID=UPI001676B728|nr:alanine racemase [Thalassotalea profundi]
MTTATATIDLSALVDNFTKIKSLAPESKVLAVLKANAYGHGLERIARSLPQADAFGVARIDEALALRADGIVKPIVLLEGFFEPQNLPVLAVNNLQTIVHNEQQLNAICNAQLDRPLKVWLKIDTGMHRLGIDARDFPRYYQQLSQSKNIQQPIILMSHLGCADDNNNADTDNQVRLFEQTIAGTNNECSLANSAAIINYPESHYQWIRPGLLLYGVSPLPEENETITVNPVMTLQSSVIAIRHISAGETVGYGATWKSDKATKIGVIAIGYGDGYPRHAENGTPILLNGRRVPLVGRVSMDMITVELGINSMDKVGDVATLWGNGLAVEEIARYSTTIPYELLCNITRRVQMTLK